MVNVFNENNFELYKDLKNYYIYLLLDNETVVYVGKTNNLEARIKAHEKQGKAFDSVKRLEIGKGKEAEQLTELAEFYYIAKYKPKYNNTNVYPKRFTTVERMTKPLYTTSFILDKFIVKHGIEPIVLIDKEKFYDSQEVERKWVSVYGSYRQLSKDEKDELV